MTDLILDQAVGWLMKKFIKATLGKLWQLLAITLFHLPDVTGIPQVQAIAARSLFIVNTAYVLAAFVTALAVMAHGTLQDRYGIGELLPRLLIGLAAANFSVPLTRFLIRVANTLVVALSGGGLSTDAALDRLKELIMRQLSDDLSALLMAIMGMVMILIVVMLIVGWITRFVVLIVLCGIAPLALACHGTPWTEGLALLWWRATGGIIATVVLQATALNTTLSIMLDPHANFRLSPSGADSTGLLNMLIVACLLWFTARIPAVVGQYLAMGGNRNTMGGGIVRLVVVQQLTRGLRGSHSSHGSRGAGRTATTNPAPAIDQVKIPYRRPRQTPVATQDAPRSARSDR